MLGPERAGQEAGEEPQYGYVPSERVLAGDTEHTVELRRIANGQVALLAFSSLETLVEGCGENQSWVLYSAADLDELQQECGADVLLWDVTLPADQRKD
ncbi:MAG: hypothetical protein GEU98_25350 [Pseudonocardiaceae bacterium]|nr:hypothetical protein [Pseudonocardiaceae bacterium]